MASGNIFQVNGQTNLADSNLVVNVSSAQDIGQSKIVMQSSQGINGQFKTVGVNDNKALTSDCESLKGSPAYSDDGVLSIFISKDSTGCNQAPANTVSGIEIAMVVIVIIFGVAIIAVSVIFIYLRKKRFNKSMDNLTRGTMAQMDDNRQRSNLPGED